MPRRSESIRHVTFASEGGVRRVDLRAPIAVRRGSRWLVPLVDLWVASGLPGNLLDLAFEMITTDSVGGAIRTNTLDPQRFARGFVGLHGGQLWWDDPATLPSTAVWRERSSFDSSSSRLPSSSRRGGQGQSFVVEGSSTRSVGVERYRPLPLTNGATWSLTQSGGDAALQYPWSLTLSIESWGCAAVKPTPAH